ncbi:MAG: CDP-diacylglycerol pyrophosphatase [Gammaproteobacteria bacterium]|nr:CDP-diacylglycerol pyrophosphatase [Gammaproteobacteria bacterium]
MNAKLRRHLFTAFAAAIIASSAAGGQPRRPPPSSGSSTYSPEIGTAPDSLRRIVQDQCVINWSQHHNAAPCERVFLADAKTGYSGYAVLADRKGGAHYLLIPTQTMAGIDGAELLDPDAPNYFAEAWHARDLITKFVGHDVPRTAIGLAVNTARSRSQDQFHIHIECLRRDVFESLRAAATRVTDVWSPVNIAGSTYDALRIMGDGLDGSNPFELLANLKPEVRHHMGDYTLLVAGMQFQNGPGFIALTGTGPTGELLLDSTCTVAGAGG